MTSCQSRSYRALLTVLLAVTFASTVAAADGPATPASPAPDAQSPTPATAPAAKPTAEGEQAEEGEQATASGKPAVTAFTWDQVEARDRILWLGDDFTQQMHYTRAVAAAMLAMQPELDLRFFNGGRSGSTTAQAVEWSAPLLDLTRSTVVFICFGANDQAGDNDALARQYRRDLTRLTQNVAKYPTVAHVVLISPGSAPGDPLANLGSQNDVRRTFSQVTEEVAGELGVGAVKLGEHLSDIEHGKVSAPAAPLTLGGRLLSEYGHIVAASVVLRDIGVDAKTLDPIGWSPLLPGKMAKIRPALAIQLKAPPFDRAQISRELYTSMARFDEAFFVTWRLAGTAPSAPTPQAAASHAEDAWTTVRQLVNLYRTGRGD